MGLELRGEGRVSGKNKTEWVWNKEKKKEL